MIIDNFSNFGGKFGKGYHGVWWEFKCEKDLLGALHVKKKPHEL